MQSSARTVAWTLGIFAVVLVLASLFAMTGVMGLDETMLGSYTGMHIAGVVLAFVGVLALVAVLLRGKTRA